MQATRWLEMQCAVRCNAVWMLARNELVGHTPASRQSEAQNATKVLTQCLLPSGNPFKCHVEVLYLQPMIPPKRFDIFSPLDWGMLKRSRCVQVFLEKKATNKCSTFFSTRPLHTNSGCGKERRILIGPW